MTNKDVSPVTPPWSVDFRSGDDVCSKDYGFGDGCGGYGECDYEWEDNDYEKMDIDYRKKVVVKETINTKYSVKVMIGDGE